MKSSLFDNAPAAPLFSLTIFYRRINDAQIVLRVASRR